MTWLWWTVLICVLIACPIAAGIYLGKARESGETERLRESFADLEREVGTAFLPILERAAKHISKWNRTR